MKNHLEIEYKTLLTKSEYLRLLSDFSDVSPVLQTNHYIDTPDLDMKNHRFSLRIRTFKEIAELTLKIPQEIGNQEYNQVLDIQTAHQLIENFQLPAGHIADIISATDVPIDKLAVWGSLTTKRHEKETSIGLMALDENEYAGQVDYELEVEVTDAHQGKILFEDFLKKNSIQFKYARSKVARTASHRKSVQ
ncbi:MULTISPECIES: CYTH domain-containing protein [Streptococcus]|uniref:CYTH domain-containing protein n=1 Tax=Streptococcus iners subsp. hyiners TaxID=3028083 RepID=A0AA96VND1_9STRE|nr:MULTISPECIES: CYTH domain-containing protein [Streptococcus]MCK4029938.1 CYTH domain-containing protein [Streptococcus suis]WNY48239.1 CYTH domain-containing protein [Streptococcus sp. 29892]